jgi:DsbC/DsbD-like thiol-disulfide interchange protein
MSARKVITKLLTQLAQAAVVCLVSAACAFAQNAQPAPAGPVKWSLKADLPAKPLKAGDKFTAQLTAEIEDGWHLYSTEEMPEGPKPTRITLAPNQPFDLSDIESPTPRKELDPNFGIETEFYEHSVIFTLPVQVKADAIVGTHKLAVQVRYQCCSETLCLPPRVVKLEVEVPVKDNAAKPRP